MPEVVAKQDPGQVDEENAPSRETLTVRIAVGAEDVAARNSDEIGMTLRSYE
jgi:hypothetical protein